MTDYGVTSTGFVPKSMQQILSELTVTFQQTFGSNVNLTAQEPIGQIMNIYAEREALIWQLGEAIYASQYPAGAEGTSMDNVLALSNLKRLPKTATITSPDSNGLVFYGTTGTVISAGYQISVSGNPALIFSVDNPVTIGNAENAVQQITFQGGPATKGEWKLQIVDPLGVTLSTGLLAYNISATGGSGATGSVQNAIQALHDTLNAVYPYSDVSVSGAYTSAFLVTFGGITGGAVASGGMAQNPFTSPIVPMPNTLQNQNLVVNVETTVLTTGTVPLGTGSATAITPGPTEYVAAGMLNVIQTYVSGWSAVSNPLDCIPGSLAETDGDARTRRLERLNSSANGTLQSIVSAVESVENVLSAVGYENTSLADWQFLSFNPAPTSELWTITFNPSIGSPVTTGYIEATALSQTAFIGQEGGVVSGGTFKLTYGTHTTTTIPWNATAAQIQQYLAQAGADGIIVTGTINSLLYFNLGSATNLYMTMDAGNLTYSTTGTPYAVQSIQAAINAQAAYIDATITGTYSSGFQIKFGNTVSGAIEQGVVTVAFDPSDGPVATSVPNLPAISFEIIFSDDGAADSKVAKAIFDIKPAGILAYGSSSYNISDSSGNAHEIGFTRATPVPIYVSLSLTTDLLTAKIPQFTTASITTIQEEIVAKGSEVGIGGTVIGYGSEGLVGAFNGVAGIDYYQMSFGITGATQGTSNIPMQINQIPQFEVNNILVAYI